jgi:hypothetical protein
MSYEQIASRSVKATIISDQTVKLKAAASLAQYPESIRLIKAKVQVDGKEKIMTFMTNNMKWAPLSICDLYKARWSIEVFFKQMKQTLQLSDFLGHSKEAVSWQIWTALLTHLLLRFIVSDPGTPCLAKTQSLIKFQGNNFSKSSKFLQKGIFCKMAV